MPGIHNGIGTTFRSQAFGGGAAPVNPDFVFTVDTTQAGSAADTIVLPLLSGGTYSGTIDWGDTSTSSLSYANRSHTYASGGTYTITISGDTLQGWQFANAGDKAKMTEISNWGLFEFTEIRTFQGCSNMDITATDVPTISTTDFSTNFFECNGITTTQDWSDWDMTGVTTYTNCFAGNTAFNGDLSNWVTASTTGVSKMFNNATAFNGTGLDTWVTDNITVWTEFARGATSFNSDVSGWVVNGAMTSAFLGCSSFVGNGCSTWDVSGMTSASGLFSQCVLFSENIFGWDTSSLINATSMLRNCDAFDRNLANWSVSQITSLTNFMTDATGLSTAGYDALLVGWEADLQAAYPGGAGYPATINVNFGGSQFTSGGFGETAKNSLVTNFGWTITDGGGI